MVSGISVIICCHNSASRLPKTLEYLSKQELDKKFLWEIIIVDNASTDDTTRFAEQEWLKQNNTEAGFSVVEELKPGLSNARKTGLLKANYEYIIFCDDDNWLDKNYLSLSFALLEEDRTIGVLGGRSQPASDFSLPYWFSTYQNLYAVGVQNLNSGDVSDRRFIWGAGMILRKSVLIDLFNAGFISLLTDRKGNAVSSGGDSEICKWFLIAGYKLWYDESLHFKHYIPQNRLTKNYLNSLRQSFNESYGILRYYDFYLDISVYKHSGAKTLLKLIYHSLKLVFSGNEFSRFCLLTFLPITMVKRLNPRFFLIRRASENYKKRLYVPEASIQN